MSKLQLFCAKKLEKALFHLGFLKVRQKGSHVFYRHPDGRTTTVPHHEGTDLSRPLVRAILKEINVDLDSFHELLETL